MTTTSIPVKSITSAADMVLEDRVHKSLYSDPEIFEQELDKVFNHTWVWLAHESEVPDAGSYKTAKIGRQPVIVVRDRKGNIHVLQNRCRHRGATVCEKKHGKTKAFTCPYHGWGYGLDGGLRLIEQPRCGLSVWTAEDVSHQPSL